ncbi:MAG: hypothetical protein FNT29_07965 [Halothiobacillaceae bacterium]|nr:MAG: hypothetical protein FNT29_07965 [Halothiobacillaceae bacterium]
MAEATTPIVYRLALSLLVAYRPYLNPVTDRAADLFIPAKTVDALSRWVAHELTHPDEAMARAVLPHLLTRFERLIHEQQGGAAWSR